MNLDTLPPDTVRAPLAGTSNAGSVPEAMAGHAMASAILANLARRERSDAQAKLFRELNAMSIGRHLVFTGGAALHGVYLHRRLSDNLDFEAPYAIALRFHDLAVANGLSLMKGNSSGSRLIYTSEGRIHRIIQFEIRINIRNQRLYPAEARPFVSGSGHAVDVRVLPLAEIMTIKLGCLFKRRHAIDAVDLWWGMQDPEVRESMRAVMQNAKWNCGTYTPPAPFRARHALENLEALRPAWSSELQGNLSAAPPFDQVYEDLCAWLSSFERSAAQK
jgi:predicted nucleotidyltransferase component of viral defense system